MNINKKERYYGSGIASILHPEWCEQTEWLKWRLAYDGGKTFVNDYLYKMSARESDPDLLDRKKLSPVPWFAGEAVDEIKKSIYSRMVDICREGGPVTYQRSCAGEIGGVDYDGSKMSTFIGTDVLRELLVMRTVGVLIDAPKYQGDTLSYKGDKHPYLCVYPRESIKSYSFELIDNIKVLKSLIVTETVDQYDEQTGCCNGTVQRHRLMRRLNGRVEVTFHGPDGLPQQPIYLDIAEIPFVFFRIDKSLMEIVADHQIALLNLESADIAYALKANFPFFYEFFDKNTEQTFGKPAAAVGEDGTAASQNVSKPVEKAVGSNVGRRYPSGIGEPGFINPSAETLMVSMKLKEQLKNDIRRLVNLNLTEATAKLQSSDSKAQDKQGLDSSLSAIGMILERGENEIGRFWAMFEGAKDKPPTVKYPTDYSLKSEEDRQQEAEKLEERMTKIPSPKYKKEIAKQITTVTIGHKVSKSRLDEIHKEIDGSDTLTTDPDLILEAHEAGLVDDVTASNALGFDGEKIIEQAKKDRVERMKMTLEMQMEASANKAAMGDGAARGVPELGGKTSKEEKEGKDVRGEGKAVNKEGE
jgi:hypothetical protein